MMQPFPKIGLDALLTPENCVFLLIDHQPFQLANVNSHDPTNRDHQRHRAREDREGVWHSRYGATSRLHAPSQATRTKAFSAVGGVGGHL